MTHNRCLECGWYQDSFFEGCAQRCEAWEDFHDVAGYEAHRQEASKVFSDIGPLKMWSDSAHTHSGSFTIQMNEPGWAENVIHATSSPATFTWFEDEMQVD